MEAALAVLLPPTQATEAVVVAATEVAAAATEVDMVTPVVRVASPPGGKHHDVTASALLMMHLSFSSFARFRIVFTFFRHSHSSLFGTNNSANMTDWDRILCRGKRHT